MRNVGGASSGPRPRPYVSPWVSASPSSPSVGTEGHVGHSTNFRIRKYVLAEQERVAIQPYSCGIVLTKEATGRETVEPHYSMAKVAELLEVGVDWVYERIDNGEFSTVVELGTTRGKMRIPASVL